MSQNWKDWPVRRYSNLETLEHLAERFQYRGDDVLINTYYKSGTTLTQELVYALLHGVEAAKASNLGQRSPFLDWCKPNPQTGFTPIQVAEKLPPRRVLKTHLPAAFHLRHLLQQPDDSSSAGPKVIVVMRNPKDTVVSAFHHFSSSSMHIGKIPEIFADFWKILALGSRIGEPDTGYHNYFDFTLSWWSMRKHPRVRVYFYEDMVKRKAETIASVAQFLGVDISQERIQAIMDHTSFDSMRSNPRVNPTLQAATGPGENTVWVKPEFNFVRKGKIGDWKNHFSVADSDLMDRVIAQRLDQSGLQFVYE